MASEYDNFFSKVSPEPNTGCWLWLGPPRSNHGYGRITVRGKMWMAHRYSYYVHKGAIPKGQVVMHLCDCVACVNPDHLKLGTVADNNKDAKLKGRTSAGANHSKLITPTAARGARNSATKLKEEDVVFIRSSKLSQRQLAKKYSITQAAIYNAIHKISWKWVK